MPLKQSQLFLAARIARPITHPSDDTGPVSSSDLEHSLWPNLKLTSRKVSSACFQLVAFILFAGRLGGPFRAVPSPLAAA